MKKPILKSQVTRNCATFPRPSLKRECSIMPSRKVLSMSKEEVVNFSLVGKHQYWSGIKVF
jgi:hypothetical protein